MFLFAGWPPFFALVGSRFPGGPCGRKAGGSSQANHGKAAPACLNSRLHMTAISPPSRGHLNWGDHASGLVAGSRASGWSPRSSTASPRDLPCFQLPGGPREASNSPRTSRSSRYARAKGGSPSMSLLGSQVTTSPEPERDPGLFRILSDHLSLQSLVPRSDTVVDTVHELLGGFNPPREFVLMLFLV